MMKQVQNWIRNPENGTRSTIGAGRQSELYPPAPGGAQARPLSITLVRWSNWAIVLLQPLRIYASLTFSPRGPFGPCPRSNVTACPSRRSSKWV